MSLSVRVASSLHVGHGFKIRDSLSVCSALCHIPFLPYEQQHPFVCVLTPEFWSKQGAVFSTFITRHRLASCGPPHRCMGESEGCVFVVSAAKQDVG
jgi:hypothetical protein